jgi:hypothetical protein
VFDNTPQRARRSADSQQAHREGALAATHRGPESFQSFRQEVAWITVNWEKFSEYFNLDWV